MKNAMLEFMMVSAAYVRALDLNSGAKFRSMHDFFLHNGREFPTRSQVDTKPLMGEVGHCFMNAARLAMDRPSEFIYCEGYANLVPQWPEPMHHAWLVDSEGAVIEVTHPADFYLGIAVQHDFMMSRIEETNYFGLFTGMPDLDLSFVNMSPENWRHPVMNHLPELDLSEFEEKIKQIKEQCVRTNERNLVRV